MRVTDIAVLVGVETPTVTRKVQQLEHQGYVARLADPNDRRAALIALTDEGRAVVDSIIRVRQEMIARVVANWSTGELDTFAQLLTRFTNSLTTEAETYLD